MLHKHATKVLTCFAGRVVPAGFDTQPVQELSQKAARQGFDLCYGGGETGLLGILAETFHCEGRVVHATLLQDEPIPCHVSPENVVRVTSAVQRSQMLIQRADAVCVLPGGWGTLAELFALLHACAESPDIAKPCVLFNGGGVLNHLLEALEKLQQDGWLPAGKSFFVANSADGATSFLRKVIRQ